LINFRSERLLGSATRQIPKDLGRPGTLFCTLHGFIEILEVVAVVLKKDPRSAEARHLGEEDPDLRYRVFVELSSKTFAPT